MVLDLERVKAELDCRNIAERVLGQPAGRSGKYIYYRCPFHGEKKGYSLTIWRDGWKCWGACDTGGDVISLVMKLYRIEFVEALQLLGVDNSRRMIPALRPVHQMPPEPEGDYPAPDEEWQEKAHKLVEMGQEILHSEEGKRAREYLSTRGVSPYWILKCNFGFIPGKPDEWKKLFGLNVPCGILIPSYAHGILWNIRVRRAAGQPKYLSVGGGKLLGSLFLADHLVLEWQQPVVIVEGEFDAITISSNTPCFGVALSSANNNKLSKSWLGKLVFVPTIFTCLDNDRAGQKATAVLGALSARVQRIELPENYKDPNEWYQADSIGMSIWFSHLSKGITN